MKQPRAILSYRTEGKKPAWAWIGRRRIDSVLILRRRGSLVVFRRSPPPKSRFAHHHGRSRTTAQHSRDRHHSH